MEGYQSAFSLRFVFQIGAGRYKNNLTLQMKQSYSKKKKKTGRKVDRKLHETKKMWNRKWPG